jgi:hypothetical protein
MINYSKLENNREQLRMDFLLAKPFPHLAIDDFCEEEKLRQLLSQMPVIETKSRDYVFASNKFERSSFREISPLYTELYEDLLSKRFGDILKYISNENVFVDTAFHGGGIHQGKKNSFLDMHIDFNYHPLHADWYRTLNLILYLNKNWQPSYGGQLKLEDLRSGEKSVVDIPFNRMVIQLTGKHTLHGYDRTDFPEGQYRTSIAAYAYTIHKHRVERARTTDWHPGEGQYVKKFLAKVYDPAVKVKNKLFGSSTARH